MEHPSKARTRNKVHTYIFYAIGEILLVVIGILIALQVNNWNEDIKEANIEKELLTSVMQSLKSDSVAFSNTQNYLNRIRELHQNIYRYKNNGLDESELRDINLIRRSSGMTPVTKSNYPDLADKVSSQELKNEILNYYQAMDLLAFIEDNFNEILENQMRAHLANYKLLNYGYFDSVDPQQDLIIRDRFIEHIKSDEFIQLLFNVRVKIELFSENLERSISQNTVLRNEIKKHL